MHLNELQIESFEILLSTSLYLLQNMILEIEELFQNGASINEKERAYSMLEKLVDENPMNYNYKFKLALMSSYDYFDYNVGLWILNELLGNDKFNSKFILLKAFIEHKRRNEIQDETIKLINDYLDSIKKVDFYWMRLYYFKFIYIIDADVSDDIKYKLLFQAIEKNYKAVRIFEFWSDFLKSRWFNIMSDVLLKRWLSNIKKNGQMEWGWYNYLDFDEVIKEMIDWIYIPCKV